MNPMASPMPVTSQVTASKRMMWSSSYFLISLLRTSYMGSKCRLSAIPGNNNVGSEVDHQILEEEKQS